MADPDSSGSSGLWRRGATARATPYQGLRVSEAGTSQYSSRGRRGFPEQSRNGSSSSAPANRGRGSGQWWENRGGAFGSESGRARGRGEGRGRARGRGEGRGRARGRGEGRGPARGSGDAERVHVRGKRNVTGGDAIAAMLPSLLSEDQDVVIARLSAKDKDFEELINSEFHGSTRQKLLITLVQILAEKLCGQSNLRIQRNPLLAKCCKSSFINQLKDLILNLTEDPSSPPLPTVAPPPKVIDQSPLQILNNVYTFTKFVTTSMPSQCADNFLNVVKSADLVIPVLQQNPLWENHAAGLDDLVSKFHHLKIIIQEFLKRREDATTKSADGGTLSFRAMAAIVEAWRAPPPNDFRSLSVIPTPEELLSERKAFLRPSLTHGKYPSVQDYLDVQFRLLREDMVAPLREGIQDYFSIKSNKKKMTAGSIKVYRNVQLLPRLNFDTHTPYYIMKLNYEQERYLRKVKWDKSKRLLNLSLLLLTKDNFETMYFATICKRDLRELQQEGKFGIIWEAQKPEFAAESYFDIVECDVYFESYRHTLMALKTIELEVFPMAKYIVDADMTPRIPPYIQNMSRRVNFATLIPGIDYDSEEYGTRNICDLSTWPSAEEMKMDDSQYEAFCAALTREISIIQGPPGTGKTFIAIQIAKFLLANRSIFFPIERPKATKAKKLNELLASKDEDEPEDSNVDSRPVLVVCYTNHALDQFLEAIVTIMETMGLNPKENLIRVGGQSKSEVMKELLLHKRLDEARERDSLPFYLEKNLNQARRTLSDTKRTRLALMEQLKNLKTCDSILNLKYCFNLTGSGLESAESEILTGSGLESAESEILSRLDDDGSMKKCKGSRVLEKHFGLYDDSFYSADFRKDVWIERIFGNRIQARVGRPTKSVVLNTMPRPPQSAHEETGTEDVEDYDLEELMHNRIVELEFELDMETNKNEDTWKSEWISTSNAKESPSAKALLQQLEAAENQFRENEQDENAYRRLIYTNWRYQAEVEMLERQYATIRDIFQLYNDQRLQLDLFYGLDFFLSKCILSSLDYWTIYFLLLEKCKRETLKAITKVEEELVGLDEQLKEAQNACFSYLLKMAKFVGMTTTGAAKYNSLLPSMKSRLVIVEEAAEVLEAHVISCITQYCEHLILIGDHKQLRPKTAVYNLAKQFNLDVSLFERMINNNLNLYRLGVQHRMRPEICELIVPTIYETLENHSSVLDYPSVPGITTNMYFISHKELEREESDSTSKSNTHEADFLVRLCRHLLLQGYTPERITILTTYIGQMFLIKGMTRDFPECRGVRVTVVDNFQGEENDIILLSLVRSNQDNKIGFLKTENRICVALSRAKHGLFVIGNMDSMVASSPTWKTIVEGLTQKDLIGPQLKLKCQVHGDIILAERGSDFDKSPEGGCSKMCEGLLERCGHICNRVCHTLDMDHLEYKCRLPCELKCDKYGHPCTQDCFEKCRKCAVVVATPLNCGHQAELECYIDASTYPCTVRVTKALPCLHERLMFCYMDPSEAKCTTVVFKQLVCGHDQAEQCHVKLDEIDCFTKIKVKIPACEHELEIHCYQKEDLASWICSQACDTRLQCGHACTKKCHTDKDPNHDNYKCQKDCTRSCPNGHKCGEGLYHNHKCHSKCPPCDVPTNKTLGCGHDAVIACAASLDGNYVVQCKVSVNKRSMDCIHEIDVHCHETAIKSLCNQLVVSKLSSPCGHVVKIPCRLEHKLKANDVLEYCDAPCGVILLDDDKVGCQHVCTGSCSTCFQKKLHQKCTQKCGRQLVCGHVCKSPCSSVCPPCREKCEQRCVHSKCKETCGVPCLPCQEPCDWVCEHHKCTKRCGLPCNRDPCDIPCNLLLPCTHACVGLCSEPCPRHCRICNKEELTELFFGDEDEPNARYIELLDCGHVFEVHGLDKWILEGVAQNPIDGNRVHVKKCPKCSTQIRISRRYNNEMKKTYMDVARFKRLVYGKNTEAKSVIKKVAKKLESRIKTSTSLFWFAMDMSRLIYKEKFNPLLPTNFRRVNEQPPRRWETDFRIYASINQYELESLTTMFAWWEEAIGNLGAGDQGAAAAKPVNVLRNSRFTTRDVVPPAMGSQTVTTGSLTTYYQQDLEERYDSLFRIVSKRQLPLSQFEIKQFSYEFKRSLDLFQLYRRYSVEGFQKYNVQGKCDELKQLILNAPAYKKPVQTEFQGKLKDVDAMMKLRIPTIKRETLQEIFKALEYATGTWYTCPSNHLYQIGDCGQPNETSRCPDCKATIGASRYHVAAERNTLIASGGQHPSTNVIPDISTPDFLE